MTFRFLPSTSSTHRVPPIMALSRFLLLLVVLFVSLAAHHAIGATALGVGEFTSLRAQDHAIKSTFHQPIGVADADGARRTALERRAATVVRSLGSSAAAPGGPKSPLSMLPPRALPRRALKDGATTADLSSPLQVAETDSENDTIEDSAFEEGVLGGGAAEIGVDARRGLRISDDVRKRGTELVKKAAGKAGEKAAKKAIEFAAKKALTSAGGSAVGGIASILGVGGGDTMLSKVGSDIEKTGKVGRVIGKVMQNKVVNAVVNTVAPKPLMAGLNVAAEHYDDIKREGGKAGKAVGNEVNKAGKAVGNEVNKAGKAVGTEVNKAGKAVGNEVNKAGKAVGNEVNKAGKAVEKAGNAVGNAVGGAAKNTVNGVKKAGQAVGNAAKKVFGGIFKF
ncbi:unnamed protein product [Closterium sp. NIES-54]